MGRTALALTGRRAIPRRLLDAGFAFSYPRLASALDELIAQPAVRGPDRP